MGMWKDETYAKKLSPYMVYWENILELLSNLLPIQNSTLLESFWPLRNWRSNHMQGAIPPIVDVDPKDLVITPYCGPKNMQPSLKIVVYILFRNLGLCEFVLVKLANLKLYPMWWERQRVRLWRMNNLKILDIFIFNGGC